MPLRLPDRLPAIELLKNENIFVMDNSRAHTQDIRPLKIVILNLMPLKITTETDLIRLLSNTPLQLEVSFMKLRSHTSKNTPIEHMMMFYRDFESMRNEKFDGMIITGAPLGKVPFEEVKYWDTLVEIMKWSKDHVTCTMFNCWAVQAALNVFYDLPKQTRQVKLSGVYRHRRSTSSDPLIRGFDDYFLAPHSRFANFETKYIEENTDLEILADSDETGVYLAVSPDRRQVFVTGHPEYDAQTLDNEFRRDINAGLNPAIPVNYYLNNDPQNIPLCTWKSHAYLLFANWINYYVYQNTPYDLETMRKK